MTPPHRALLELVAGRRGPVVDDEDDLLRSAAEHRLVAVTLSAHHDGAIRLSPSGAQTLGMWDLWERRRHLMFWRTLRDVQEKLATVGAEVAVLKGIATEARWYDEIGQRACTDLDLLLAPDLLDRGAEIVALLDADRGCSAAVDWLVRRRLLQHVDLQVSTVPVDLHFDPFKIGLHTQQLAHLWETTELLETARGTVRVLRPELELVLLLLHLNKDGFAFLGPFLDIRRILGRGHLEWAYLGRFVADEGLDVPVWKSMALVADVLGLDLEVPRIDGVRARSWDRLWGGKAALQGYEGRERAPLLQWMLGLHISGRAVDNLKELRRQLIPPQQLLEVAGRSASGRSYVRYLAFDRFRRVQAVDFNGPGPTTSSASDAATLPRAVPGAAAFPGDLEAPAVREG